MEVLIALLGLAFGIGSFAVGWYYGKKSATDTAASADADQRSAESVERARVEEQAALRLANRPELFGHLASISGGGNIEVRVENRSDNLARNIEVRLYQQGELKATRFGISQLSRDDFWEKDLFPPGSNGFEPRGVEYTVVCEFDAPDGQRWRSTRVSGVNFENSRLDFEPM